MNGISLHVAMASDLSVACPFKFLILFLAATRTKKMLLHHDNLGPVWPDWANFAQWVIVYFGQCFENYRSIANFGLLFTTVPFMYKFGWATFWATFSQTHLVTLLGSSVVRPAPKILFLVNGPLTIYLQLAQVCFYGLNFETGNKRSFLLSTLGSKHMYVANSLHRRTKGQTAT
jgi:hypothetical protein